LLAQEGTLPKCAHLVASTKEETKTNILKAKEIRKAARLVGQGMRSERSDFKKLSSDVCALIAVFIGGFFQHDPFVPNVETSNDEEALALAALRYPVQLVSL
jgi:rRNA pseudouridine-1189 N-methylase Emg1 (Nep1/Mra1 family)